MRLLEVIGTFLKNHNQMLQIGLLEEQNFWRDFGKHVRSIVVSIAVLVKSVNFGKSGRKE